MGLRAIYASSLIGYSLYKRLSHSMIVVEDYRPMAILRTILGPGPRPGPGPMPL